MLSCTGPEGPQQVSAMSQIITPSHLGMAELLHIAAASFTRLLAPQLQMEARSWRSSGWSAGCRLAGCTAGAARPASQVRALHHALWCWSRSQKRSVGSASRDLP